MGHPPGHSPDREDGQRAAVWQGQRSGEGHQPDVDGGRLITGQGDGIDQGEDGALKGPLHGGAPGPVLDMLDAIGEPEAARRWLEGELEAGRRIMGLGHRIYRVRDPRAAVLERALSELWGRRSGRLELAKVVEREAEALLSARQPDRPLKVNVEFYTAILLEAIGVPRELFTAVFAAGRSAGWCAHFAEQREKGRLIRPSARYVGAWPLGEGSPQKPSDPQTFPSQGGGTGE